MDLRQQRLDGGIQGRARLPSPTDPLPHGWRAALAEHLPGEVLGLLHVGLVEHVDPQDRARDGDRILPAKEFGAETQRVIEFQRHHGVPGFAQGPEPCGIAVVAIGEGEPDEEPVVAIDLGWSQRFVGHRHQPLPFFAGALRDQLFRPEAKTVQWRRREDRDLIPAGFCRFGEDGSKPRARVLADRHRRRARLRHCRRPVQESGQVYAAQGSRYQPEVRKGRVSPADVRRVEKDSSEPSLCCFVRKRGLRVGDGDELAAVTSRSLEEVSIV